MKTRTRLLAKSSKNPESPNSEETLHGHTARVLACARRVIAAVGDSALRGAGLEPEHWRDRLELAVCLTAAIHDLGKASSQFQAMLRHELEHPQSARHEAITGLLLLGVFRTSLFDAACEQDQLAAWAALIAACGHHRKFPNSTHTWDVASSPHDLTVHTSHPDFVATINIVGKLLGVETGPAEPPAWSTGASGNLLDALDDLLDATADAFERLTESDDARRFIALVRGLAFGADVAGSALPRAQVAVADWVDTALGQRLTVVDLDIILTAKLRGHLLRPFQRAVEASRSTVTLVTAGCGTGKTAAAYAWARHRAIGRKLVFCYPTTGTTSEGFRSYLLGTEVPAALLHSRAQVDLEDMTVNGPAREEQDESCARLQALRAWPARVTACTVDTVLGALVFNRAGLFAFPALCEATFVFDEIHAYDPRMFGLLLGFLELFPRVPVLLMTASLPESRRRALHEVVAQCVEVPGSAHIEQYRRYQLAPGLLEDPPWRLIDEALREGGKILWVSNVVSRAVEHAQTAEHRGLPGGVTPLVYHSRFRYEDRVARRREIMNAFEAEGPTIAFTTQVCEMSLDLSADLLISDLAPPAALVQRLGRLNRRASPDRPSPPKPAHCINFSGLPYDEHELAAGREFWERLAGPQARSQTDLDRAFAATVRDEAVAPIYFGLRDDHRSLPDAVRERGFTIKVLLEQDVARVRSDRSALTRCEVPLLCRAAISTWERVLGVPVAPSAEVSYDERFGADTRGAP